MQLQDLYQKALQFGFLTIEEGVFLYENAPLSDLMYVANELRKKQVPHGKVTWQIDRKCPTSWDDVLDLHRFEIKLARPPGVLIAAASTTMVKG